MKNYIDFIYNMSVSYYNEALIDARQHNLSKAIYKLEKSIKIDKRNIMAHNLIALIYMEIGNYYLAEKHLRISQSLSDNQIANEYLKEIEKQKYLEVYDKSVKNYNEALILANNKEYKQAIDKLRIAIYDNPKFIECKNLMILLLIHMSEFSEAKVMILDVLKTDSTNEKASIYNYFIENKDKANDLVIRKRRDVFIENITPEFKTVGTYNEERESPFVYINLILGILLGMLITIFLINPYLNSKKSNDLSETNNNLSAKLDQKNSEILLLNDKISEKDAKIKRLEKDLKKYKDNEKVFETEQLVITANNIYRTNPEEAIEKLLEVDEKYIKDDGIQNKYNNLKENLFKNYSKKYFDQGYAYHTQGNFKEAIKYYSKSVKLFETDENLYFLANVYRQSGDSKNANKLYNKIIKNYPDSNKAVKAKQFLK